MVLKPLYHCECRTDAGDAPAPPMAPFEYHGLPSLYFCEECDAIKCSECIIEEVSLYFCPLCMFEVPTASVRSEAHRCARNCFLCPTCDHTLTVAGSDAAAAQHDPLTAASTSVADAPYFLTCSYCLWNSKEVGITFEKPTGLARRFALPSRA
jgi:dynactin-4